MLSLHRLEDAPDYRVCHFSNHELFSDHTPPTNLALTCNVSCIIIMCTNMTLEVDYGDRQRLVYISDELRRK